MNMKNPDNVTVKLTIPEVDAILIALSERPYREVADLIGNVRAQVLEQIHQFNAPTVIDQPEDVAAGGTD